MSWQEMLLGVSLGLGVSVVILVVGFLENEAFLRREYGPRKPPTAKQMEKAKQQMSKEGLARSGHFHVGSAEVPGIPESTRRLIEERSRLHKTQ